MYKIFTVAAGAVLGITSAADSAPIRYTYEGTLSGDVFNDTTGAFVETVSDFPFVWVVDADTDDVDATSAAPLIFAPGTGALSLAGTDFVEEDEVSYAVFDPVNLLIGTLDVDFTDGEGFFSNAPVPELAGYDLASNVGPITGLQTGTFFGSEALNAYYDFPVQFLGGGEFSYQSTVAPPPSTVIPLPANAVLLATALGLSGGLGCIARRRRSRIS